VVTAGCAQGSGAKVPYNLRFPGQYYQAETGLNYNWNRDYDPLTGKYIESDRIGLKAGVNTYDYALQSPVMWPDPSGEDVTVCYYPTTVGHIGVGVAGYQTKGLYPAQHDISLAFCGTTQGVVQYDDPAHDWLTNSQKQCLTIKTAPAQDDALKRFIELASKNHSYNLCNNQCTSFVRTALEEAAIPLPASAVDALEPKTLFDILKGAYSSERAGSW
jgi:RHS repeat-associated protein